MEIVGAAFRGHLDDTAAGPSELGGVVADGHVELLHRLHRRVEDERGHTEVEVLRRAATDQVIGIIPAPTGDREGGAGSRAGRHHEAVEPRELGGAAIEQGHSGDGLVLDHASDRGRTGIEQRRRFGDGYGFVDLADLKLQVHRRDYPGFDHDPGAGLRLEAVPLRPDVIDSGGKQRETVIAFRRRECRPLKTGVGPR